MLEPSPLSADDMKRLCQCAQDTLSSTEIVLTSTSYQELDAHMGRLEDAEGWIESVELDLERRLGELKNSLGAVRLQKKDIQRHFERSKRQFWSLKKATPSNL